MSVLYGFVCFCCTLTVNLFCFVSDLYRRFFGILRLFFVYFICNLWLFYVRYLLSFSDLFAAFTRPVRAVFARLAALRGSYSSSCILFVLTLSFMSESQLIYYQMTFLVIVCAFSS